MGSPLITLSLLDEARFGIKTARAKEITCANLPEMIEFCQANQVKLFIARCSAKDIGSVHCVEKQGFLLMDTLVYLTRELDRVLIPEDKAQVLIREIKPGEESQVSQIAREAFTGYYGHYHADPRLDPQACTEVYSSWAERCCTDANAANRVLVAELDGELIGFRAIRMNSPLQGECILAGVKKAYGGRRIYRSFVIEAMRWCKGQGAREILNSTHISNIAVQRTCSRLGFEALESFYTFHKWFD